MMTGAERTAAWRERRRNGERVSLLTTNETQRETLVAQGHLDYANKDDPEAIAEAVLAFLDAEETSL